MVPLGAVKGQTHGMNSMNTRNLLVFWGGGGAFAYFQAAFGSFEPLLPPLWTLFFQFFGHHTAAWGGGVMLFCFLHAGLACRVFAHRPYSTIHVKECTFF